jgi:hypothetical protein
MTELSSAAQAVLDAVEDDCIHPDDKNRIAAAALRAAAVYSYCPVDRKRLAAIADELEAQ